MSATIRKKIAHDNFKNYLMRQNRKQTTLISVIFLHDNGSKQTVSTSVTDLEPDLLWKGLHLLYPFPKDKLISYLRSLSLIFSDLSFRTNLDLILAIG